MMKTNPNESAYPHVELHKWKETVYYIDGMPNNIDREERVLHPGLSKLEAFTMAAMKGIVSNEEGRLKILKDAKLEHIGINEAIAKVAVEIAKATINKLNKEVENA